MKVTYPVIFTMADTNILIEVPELNILTEANEEGASRASLAEAMAVARDAIGISCITREDAGNAVKEASDISNVDIEKATFASEGKSVVSLVDVDLDAYRRKLDNKMVRRNVTLPNWLDREASAAHINVSRVLQEALMTQLSVSR